MTKDNKIKLHNKGQRTIQTAEGDLAPQKVKPFTNGLAERLLRLYPDELQDIANMHIPEEDEADADADVNQTWADSTVKEIKEYLYAVEIGYDDKAAKPVLVAIAEAVEAAEGDKQSLDSVVIKDLQKFLAANEVEFETDANKDTLIDAAFDFIGTKLAE